MSYRINDRAFQRKAGASGPFPLAVLRGSCALLVMVAACAVIGSAESATRSSSGGYSRPSISAPARPATLSAPSSSGYSRSSTTSAAVAAPKPSAGDRAISQSSSGDALRAFRNSAASDDQLKRKQGLLPDTAPAVATPIAPVAQAAPAPASTTIIVHHDHWWTGWGSPAPVYVPVLIQAPVAYAAPVPPLDPEPTGTAAQQPARHHSHRWVWWLLGIGLVGGIGFMGWRYMRVSSRGPRGSGAFVSNYAAVKTESEPPKPSRYRPGMVLDIDAAALILGKDQILVDQHAMGPATVSLVQPVRIGGQPFVRLHMSHGFLQIHEAADGSIDDARLFTLRDGVAPTDADEWGFWLDSEEGAIGLGTFEDKEGRVYARMWAPSREASSREEPREIWGDSARGVAMLYGRLTGLPEPAPQTDLLLIETDESDGSARVNLYAGLDLDPASLSII